MLSSPVSRLYPKSNFTITKKSHTIPKVKTQYSPDWHCLPSVEVPSRGKYTPKIQLSLWRTCIKERSVLVVIPCGDTSRPARSFGGTDWYP